MYTHTPTIFNWFLSFVHKEFFLSLVGQHKIDKYAKKFSARELLISVFTAQIRGSDSIRDLQADLCLENKKRYHTGLKSFARSTFSYWLNKVDPIIFQTLFFHTLHEVKQLTHCNGKQKENDKIYAIDSTLISLTLSVFNWAPYRRKKGAFKIHTRLDYTSGLPDLLIITDGKKTDGKTCYDMIGDLHVGSIVLIDRGYLDYKLLQIMNNKGLIFVTRTKKTTQYCPIASIPIIDPYVQYDCKVEFLLEEAKKSYTGPLRIVRYIDKETGKLYEFITNDLVSPATRIAELYRKRREIETLFRRIKQNLTIKEFLGTSQNAVENQVRVAMIYYLILHYIKRKTNTKESLLTLTRKLKHLLFHRTNILSLIGNSVDHIMKATAPPGQGLFSDF